METLIQPQSVSTPTQTETPKPPSQLQVLGQGTEIKFLSELNEYATPAPRDNGKRNYHIHNNLTPHIKFASNVVNTLSEYGLMLDDIAMKVDRVEDYNPPAPTSWGGALLHKAKPKKVANRFFLIARVKNDDFQVAPDVQTFIIARNSHDKRIPMEFAIGNKVTICSNLMFGGDISIKAKNSTYGFDTFKQRLHDLLNDYRDNVEKTREEILFFKNSYITPEEGLSFIGSNASSGKFIPHSRTAAVCDMFLKPEHADKYQTPYGDERWSLWRLLNAYTYAHRGDIAIDPATKQPYPDNRRTSETNLQNKKKYTKALWQTLLNTRIDTSLKHVKPKWHWQKAK
jgi:hypothetical protein